MPHLREKKHSSISSTMVQWRDGIHLHPSHRYVLVCNRLTIEAEAQSEGMFCASVVF